MALDYDSAYYYCLRVDARNKVVDALNKRIGGRRSLWGSMTLASITVEALDYARLEWPKYYGPETHTGFDFSWERLFWRFYPIPALFDLAIWQEIDGQKVLQGMALGRPSHAKGHLTIHWIERSFAPNYLKGGILLPVLACAEEYAKLLGCKRVLIKEPVDPEIYGRYGYRPFKLSKVAAKYLSKEIGHEK